MHEIEYVPRGQSPKEIHRASIALTMRKEWINRMIYAGQRLRYPPALAWLTHAAIVVDDSGGIVEAVAGGVQLAHLDDYLDWPYYLVHLDDSEHDRDQMVRHALSIQRQRQRYGWLTFASVGITLASDFNINFARNQTVICSGLVSYCMFKGEHEFPVPPGFMVPAGLGGHLGVAT